MTLSKRLDASSFLLEFFSWALLSLLGTRLYLNIANNPIVGRGNWHIAHVLWGGFFMLVGIVIYMIFYGKRAISFASVFAGVGWGLFIDEIGKFITMDNDYWFRPAIIIIYISFILLFILYRLLERKSPPNRSVLWHELLENCEELADNDLEVTEKKDLLRRIKQFRKLSPTPAESRLLLDLELLVASTPPLKDKVTFNLSQLIASLFQHTYNRLFRKKVAYYGLLIYSLWYTLDKLIDAVRLLSNPNKLLLLQSYYQHYDFFSRTEIYMISLKFITEIFIALLFILGLFYWSKKKNLRGIKFYQIGLLINIFIGSPLKFYFEQFSAVFALIVALIVWFSLDTYRQEHLLNRRSS